MDSDGGAVKNNATTESTPATPSAPSSTSTLADSTPSTAATTVNHGSVDNTLDSLLNYDMSDIEPLSSHFLSDHIFTTSSSLPIDENLSASNLPDYNDIINESMRGHSFNKDVLSCFDGGLESWNMDSTVNVDISGHTTSNLIDKSSICQSMPESPMKTTRTDSDQIHDKSTCVQLIASTLYSLSLPFSFCTTSPGLEQPSTIDRVLNTNRRAITASYTLLKCPCAQSSSSALSIALIILKILDAYGAIARSSGPAASQTVHCAAGNDRNSKDGNSESVLDWKAGTSTSSSLLSAPQFGQNLVPGAPITIGVYEICAEDERRIILNLLISELRRVELLAEEFGQQYKGDPARKEENIYGTVKNFILTRVYAIQGELNAALQWA